jgi:hypothetical protein
MPIPSLPTLVIRGFQALLGIIVFGLLITLIRGHHWGSLPTSLWLAAFIGGITFLAAITETAATWFQVKVMEGVVGTLIDGVMGVLSLAGGIVSRRHSSSFVAIESLVYH